MSIATPFWRHLAREGKPAPTLTVLLLFGPFYLSFWALIFRAGTDPLWSLETMESEGRMGQGLFSATYTPPGAPQLKGN
jgi:hypothetical protein